MSLGVAPAAHADAARAPRLAGVAGGGGGASPSTLDKCATWQTIRASAAALFGTTTTSTVAGRRRGGCPCPVAAVVEPSTTPDAVDAAASAGSPLSFSLPPSHSSPNTMLRVPGGGGGGSPAALLLSLRLCRGNLGRPAVAAPAAADVLLPAAAAAVHEDAVPRRLRRVEGGGGSGGGPCHGSHGPLIAWGPVDCERGEGDDVGGWGGRGEGGEREDQLGSVLRGGGERVARPAGLPRCAHDQRPSGRWRPFLSTAPPPCVRDGALK